MRNVRRIPALLTAAALSVSVLSYESIILSAQENKSSNGMVIYHAVQGETSEYGLAETKYVDANGNEFVPKAPQSDIYSEELGSGQAEGRLPVYFDLREENRVSPVRNQNPYGTCWAHASLASAESSMISKGYADQDVDYSEKHLVWFSNGNCAMYQSPDDPTYGDSYIWSVSEDPEDIEKLNDRTYNGGGDYSKAASALTAWKGAELEANVPYSSIASAYNVDESKRYDSYGHLRNEFSFNLNSYYENRQSQYEKIKRMLINGGAMYCSYIDYSPYYNSTECSYYSPESRIPYGTGHAVTIVGWDDNFSADRFMITPPGNGAWIIKNSWDSSWGDDGYFYMSYYDKSLFSASYFDMEAADNYDNNYTYSGNSSFSISYSDYGTAANVFTAKGDETLEAISIENYGYEYPVLIRIYTDTPAGDPTGGKLMLSQRAVTTGYADYETIELDKKIFLPAGTRYTVAVTSNSLPLCTDRHCFAEDTSYFCLGDSEEIGKMTDVYNYKDEWDNTFGNFTIKAFTNDYKGSDGIRISQNNFPDSRFRSVISSYDTDRNGVLSESENMVLTELDLDSMGITRLDGAESLRYLTKLSCRNNQLKKLDLSGCSSLKELHCDGNMLTSVDLSGTAVKTFSADNNALDIGSIRDYYSLYLLDRYGFDAQKASGWNGAHINMDGIVLESFSESGSTVTYSYDCGNGLSAQFALSYNVIENGVAINEKNFPDSIFREYVSAFDTDRNGSLSVAERNAVTKINIDDMNISSIEGILYFVNLEELSMNNNKIEIIPDELFLNLSRLSFDSNRYNRILYIPNDSKLEFLSCRYNCIPFISNHSSASILAKGNVFDLGDIGERYYIKDWFDNNFYLDYVQSITGARIYVDPINDFEKYFCDFDEYEGDHGTIEMEYLVLGSSENESYTIVFTYTYVISKLTIDEQHFRDKVLRDYVRDNFDTDGDGILSHDELTAATHIDLSLKDENDTSHEKLRSLQGIEHLKYLTGIHCDYNDLTSADLSKNPSIKQLNLNHNKLESINVTGCTNLNILCVDDNNLESLSLPDVPTLKRLQCSQNPLKNFSVGTIGQAFVYLSDTLVENIDLSKKNVRLLECNNVDTLKSIDISGCNFFENLSVSYCENLTSIYTKGISKKIEAFNVYSCPKLSGSFDFSGCSRLYSFSLCGNVEEVDISGTKIWWFSENLPMLKKLRLDNCSELERISLSSTKLTSLSLSNCPVLEYIGCSDSQLRYITISDCPMLEGIGVSNNPLVHIDLAGTNAEVYTSTDKPYEISCGTSCNLDLLEEYGFDPSRASGWNGADYDKASNTLSNFTSDLITFAYDCGNGQTAELALLVTDGEKNVTMDDIDSMTAEELAEYINNFYAEAFVSGNDEFILNDVQFYAVQKMLSMDNNR